MKYIVTGQTFEKKDVNGIEKIFDAQGKCLFIGRKGEQLEVVFAGAQPRIKVTSSIVNDGRRVVALYSFNGRLLSLPTIE